MQIVVSASGLELGAIVKGIWPSTAVTYRHEIWTALRGLAVRLGAAMLRQSSVTVERFWAAALGIGTVSALSYTQLGTNMLSKIFSTGNPNFLSA